MNRNQPPCNTCPKHDCRSCAWTSLLDASYRTLIQSHSILSFVALAVKEAQPAPAEPGSLGAAARRVVRFFSELSLRAR